MEEDDEGVAIKMDLKRFVGKKVVVQLSTPYMLCGPDDDYEINVGAVNTPEGIVPLGNVHCLIGKLNNHDGSFYIEYDFGPKIGWTKAPVRAYLNPSHVVAMSVFHDRPERPSNILMPSS